MPSEQRLHPTTLLFDLAGHAKRFAFPALLVLAGLSQSTGGSGGRFARAPDGWEAWLLVLFVPAVLLSIARYLSFRLRYEEHELVIRSGLVFRTERKIPYSRIQNVDAIQNAVHRLLHVVEVRVETGGGKAEEARLSVLPLAALEELRTRVFGSTGHLAPRHESTGTHPTHSTHGTHPVLVHLPPRELLLFGFLENKGMVLIAAGFGAAWESGALNLVSNLFIQSTGLQRGVIRDLIRSTFDGGPLPVLRIAIGIAVFAIFLGLVRVLSMAWAVMRLYDFRLTRIGEDLRSEYGLFTRVTATVPIRRVQTLTFRAGPMQRWLDRASVRVTTAGGAGQGDRSNRRGREWLAPLIKEEALPQLLQQIVPGFDLDAVNWQPLHPRAFARAVKPRLLVTILFTVIAAFTIGWGAIGAAIILLLWSIIGARQYVKHVGWAEGDEVVMMRSGWIWQQTTLARVNKIQAVTMHQSPFDRRAAMSGVRVDTAGAGELSHRVAIPFLDQEVARGLAGRLSAAAANTAFRW
jgi:putative membrane protein